jgi:hypothetical protein
MVSLYWGSVKNLHNYTCMVVDFETLLMPQIGSVPKDIQLIKIYKY